MSATSWWVEPVGRVEERGSRGAASWVTATLVEEQMKAGPAHILPLTSNPLCSSPPQHRGGFLRSVITPRGREGEGEERGGGGEGGAG